MKKKHKVGFIVGRFQMPHNMHMELIRQGAARCEHLIVVVGSAQESGTLRNPFDAHIRASLIMASCSDLTNVSVRLLNDYTHEDDHSHAWGRYLIEHVRRWALEIAGTTEVSLMVYGNDEYRLDWFDESDIVGIEHLILDRGEVRISSTELRNMMIENNYMNWRNWVHKNIHKDFARLRRVLMNVVAYGAMTDAPENKWVELRQRVTPNGATRIYSHSKWCNAIGVGVLVYKKAESDTSLFLGRYELCPAHGDGYKLGLIVGGYDNMPTLSLEECAVNEVLEEGGYIVSPNDLQYLGMVRPSKGSDTVEYLFAVDVTGLDQGELIGDGTISEEGSYTQWLDEDALMNTNDTQLLCSLFLGKKKQLF